MMLNRVMISLCCLLLAAASVADNHSMRKQPMQLAPMETKPMKMQSYKPPADSKQPGFHVLAMSWSDGFVDNVENLNLHLYNKLPEQHKDVKIEVTYYSQIEQSWVMRRGSSVGDFPAMQKRWVNNIPVAERQSQFTKMKLKFSVKIEGEVEPDYSGGAIYKNNRILKELIIPLN